MPKVGFLPNERTVDVKAGTTLLEASRKAGVAIRTRCGGNASCLMCKVHVGPGQGVLEPSAKESYKMGDWTKHHQRLACQTRVIGDAVVTLPEDPLKAAVRAKLEQLKKEKQEKDNDRWE
ncbi:2Fe-2S iron-sulfur cluster-binding protein [Marinicrinis lubricantis]|uniref:2Fe-2S iron-sulfur cluster-binding protein n=1 Tax=Marinicrinis lubricantis TaxID=2086470 RepID=A0ABW1IM27_9BACL